MRMPTTEARADDRQEEACNGQRREAIGEREEDAKRAGDHQQSGEHEPRPDLVDQHADDDAGGNRERDIEVRSAETLLIGELQRRADRRHQRGMVEPDDEAHEEREPGEVQDLDPGVNRKRLTPVDGAVDMPTPYQCRIVGEPVQERAVASRLPMGVSACNAYAMSQQPTSPSDTGFCLRLAGDLTSPLTPIDRVLSNRQGNLLNHWAGHSSCNAC